MTGADTTVGAHVVNALVHRGHEVRAAVRRHSDVLGWRGYGVESIVLGAADRTTLHSAALARDVVIHCVSPVRGDVQHQRERAVVGDLVRACVEAGVRRVLITTSSISCGHGETPRTEADSAVDEPAAVRLHQLERWFLDLAAALGLEAVVVCPTLVVGGPDREFVMGNSLIHRYLIDPVRTTYRGGCNVVSPRDVGSAHVLLSTHGIPGRKYIVGGENLRWREFHEMISTLCGIAGPRAVVTNVASYLASAAPRMSSGLDDPPADGNYYWYSHDQAADLGYAPRRAVDSLIEALGWFVSSVQLPDAVLSSLRLHPDVTAARERLQPWCVLPKPSISSSTNTR